MNNKQFIRKLREAKKEALRLWPAAIFLLLAGCYAPPVTDAQVKIVADRCKELGKEVIVFNGATSYAHCK